MSEPEWACAALTISLSPLTMVLADGVGLSRAGDGSGADEETTLTGVAELGGSCPSVVSMLVATTGVAVTLTIGAGAQEKIELSVTKASAALMTLPFVRLVDSCKTLAFPAKIRAMVVAEG